MHSSVHSFHLSPHPIPQCSQSMYVQRSNSLGASTYTIFENHHARRGLHHAFIHLVMFEHCIGQRRESFNHETIPFSVRQIQAVGTRRRTLHRRYGTSGNGITKPSIPNTTNQEFQRIYFSCYICTAGTIRLLPPNANNILNPCHCPNPISSHLCWALSPYTVG